MLQGPHFYLLRVKNFTCPAELSPILDKKFDFYFGTVYNRIRDKIVNFIAILFSVV